MCSILLLIGKGSLEGVAPSKLVMHEKGMLHSQSPKLLLYDTAISVFLERSGCELIGLKPSEFFSVFIDGDFIQHRTTVHMLNIDSVGE